MHTAVYWYMVIIQNQDIKRVQIKKYINKTKTTYIGKYAALPAT
jgi:hypothetical protein